MDVLEVADLAVRKAEEETWHIFFISKESFGIVFLILVLWGAEEKHEKCFEQISGSQGRRSLNGDGKGELWAGPKKL